MKRFETMHLNMLNWVEYKGHEELEHLGREGWEVKAVVTYETSTRFYLQREINDDPSPA
jgi:hypothetical protein